MRSTNWPPACLATNHANNAVLTPPTCIKPVGLGANRVLTFISYILWQTRGLPKRLLLGHALNNFYNLVGAELGVVFDGIKHAVVDPGGVVIRTVNIDSIARHLR